jgi:hypothetical protein
MWFSVIVSQRYGRSSLWPNFPPYIFLYGRREYTLQMLKTSALAKPPSLREYTQVTKVGQK